MNRLAAIILAGWCILACCARVQAQTLKERSLSDTPAQPAAAKPAPAVQQSQPAAQPVQQPQPAAQQTQSAAQQPQPAQPAQPYQPAGQQPQPAQQGQPAPQYQPATPQGQPAPPPGQAGSQPYGSPPPPGGTPINGQTSVTPPPPPPPPPPSRASTYNKEEVNREVMGFFEGGSRGLAEMVARAFKDLGQPTGFIKGNEAGGALVVGLRYGTGTLYIKGQKPQPVYWQSPSLGFDLGVNVVKVFTLVYGMTRPEEIFQRFPGVDGSAYVIGGFGMNYQRSDNVTLAPIRFGVGLRLGANVGYQHYTRNQEINPF
jgi:hypothetical protein